MIENIVRVWEKYWPLFVQGIGMTLLLSAIIVLCGSILGFLIALLRMSKLKVFHIKPLNAIASIYVEIIRGTPMLLQLYFFYFLLPEMLPFMNLPPIVCVTVALCLNSAAYVSEVIRAGIQGIDKGQSEAARSLGLNQRQAMMKVVLPQAIKNILPALGNEFVMMIKDTSLMSEEETLYASREGISRGTASPGSFLSIRVRRINMIQLRSWRSFSILSRQATCIPGYPIRQLSM